MIKSLAVLALVIFGVFSEEETEVEKTETSEEKVEAVVIFNPPKEAPGAVFFDTFQDGLGKWASTSHPDFKGRFIVDKGSKNTHEEMSEEKELLIPDKALKYGLIATEDIDLDTADGFVFQYEVRLHDGITCGGAYMKLLATKTVAEEFDDKSRYSVMFGPDKCGTDTNKVHFITQVYNPISEEWVEHHLKDAPKVKTDKKTHLYTLVVSPGQQEYEIFIDNESATKGKFEKDFEPPFQPPEEIEDADDEKPEDWVDDEMMDDPDAVKPDDWDEDARRQIKDPEASKPECWHDDEPDEVPDPEAEKPDGWDDEDDGAFEAPLIENPLCTEDCGCGEWEHPMISNPDYKGKWKAPKIENPDYQGDWKPRVIRNPAYYVHKPEHRRVSDIKGLAIDIWTMNKDVGFDNIFLGKNKAEALAFSQVSWQPKNLHEKAQSKKNKNKKDKDESGGVMGLFTKAKNFVMDYTPQCVFTTIILVISISWWCCGTKAQTPPAPAGDSAQEALVTDDNATEVLREDNSASAQSKESSDAKEGLGPAATKENANKASTTATEGTSSAKKRKKKRMES